MMPHPRNACPFCGCLAPNVLGPNSEPQTSSHAKGYQIECCNCGARGPCGWADEACAVMSWDVGDSGYRRPFIDGQIGGAA